jgi:predicted aspartyl protease
MVERGGAGCQRAEQAEEYLKEYTFDPLYIMRVRLSFRLFLLLLLASATMAQSQHFLAGSLERLQADQTTIEFTSHGSPTSTSLPFKLVDGRIFVNVSINGEGPFAFLFDTGGNATVSTDVAEQLKLPSGETETGTGTGEKPITAVNTTVRELQIGDLRMSNVAFHVISLSDAPAVFGKQPVDGIIGLPILERLVVKIDYERNRLEFTLPSAYTPRDSGTTIHFERVRYVPLIHATLDGIPGIFGVDTGARLSLLLYGPFVDQNNLRAKYHPEVSGVTGWGLGGPIRSQVARGKLFVMGNLEVHDPLVRMSLQTSGVLTASDTSGLIGPDILSQFNITLDYSRQSITLEKNHHYGKRSNFDRVGVWLGQDGAGFSVIDVISGSPADNAGIKSGDKILAIDGRPAEELELTEVREEFRNDTPGRKMRLRVQAGASSRDIVITLRDLV